MSHEVGSYEKLIKPAQAPKAPQQSSPQASDQHALADSHGSFRLAEGSLDIGDLLDEKQAARDAAESERLVELGDPFM